MDVDFSYRPNEGLPFTELERIRAKGPVFWSDTLGGWAVKRLIGALRDDGRQAERASLVPELIVRASTGSPRA